MMTRDRDRESPDVAREEGAPSTKTYSPRLEEFDEAVKHARRQFEELPDWMRKNFQSRFRGR